MKERERKKEKERDSYIRKEVIKLRRGEEGTKEERYRLHMSKRGVGGNT